ncbi:MAG TPA: amino acid adenylation domain-containing protein, partial [Longimicrobiaceae bacterium]
DERLSLGPLEPEPFGGGGGAAKSDLNLALVDDGETLTGELAYRTALWEAGSAARMTGHLELLLEAMAADPAGRVSGVPLLRGAERVQVLEAWQGARAPFPRVPVHRLVAEQAARTPHAAAVVDGRHALGYADLEREADRVAHALRARGVGPETRVAVCLERSAGLAVALLGTLRAGGAYVPLDPAYPRERLAFLLADSGARVVLTRSGLADVLPADGPDLVLLDALDGDGESVPGAEVDPDQLAYVVYTSGSTGTPKGVMVTHASLAHMVAWHVDAFGVTSADRASLVASPGFDASVMEIWPFLARGASLHPVPEETRLDPSALRDFVLQRGITVATMSTLLAEGLLGLEWPRETPLRALLCGGDVLGTRPRPGLPFALVNCYGPTEGTVNTAVGEVSPTGDALPSLGRPIARVRAYVLDARLEPVPVGVSGELCIGGAGVARGYAGRAEPTAERFVPDPFGGEPGARLYRSGDRVRWLATGELEFLGRTDQQVKVRGFRVELGEVEAALRAHPAVGAAAAAVREGGAGGKRLVGYVVAGGAEVTGAAVRAWLRDRLPEHMVPSAVVVLGALPLTRNGKTDRRALPDPRREGEAEHVAPRTATEEVLCGIWEEVLGLERVGTGDHFFEVGGHSLLATRVVSRIRETLGTEVPLRALFEAPTVAELAVRIEALRSAGAAVAPPVERVPREGPLPLSFAQQRLWLVDRMEPGSPAYNMPSALRLRGALDVEALRRSVETLVERHEALRTTFAEQDGQPVQVIHTYAPAALEVVEVAGEEEAERLAEEEALRPFDLAHGPLLRALLLRLDAEDHVVCFTLHHVVSDGWSMGVLVREVSALYGAYARGGSPGLPELPVQYADFAVWQRARLAGELLEAQVAWWKERLAGAPPLLDLPTDRPRAAGTPAGAGVHRFTLGSGVSEGLRALSRRAGATLFMTTLAAWQALLGRYAGQEDVVVGSPVAGRTRRELEGLIGFFVNMLAMRADLSGDPTFAGLLGRVREAALGTYAHQEVPFERLVEELATERSLAHAPIFQVTFALERAVSARGELSLDGVAPEPFGDGAAVAKFDLDLTVHDQGGALHGVIGYRTALFDAETIARMAGHLETLLEGIVADPERRLA